MRALFDHVFWERGFRPFFLLGACQSVLSLVLWAGFYNGSVTLPDSALDPISWHAHEMIFGFCMAIVAGFLLTAVANWTGWLPVRKGHLAFLALLWLAGRVAISVDLNLSRMAVISLSMLFVPALAISLAVPLLKSWSVRNFIFLALLSAVAITDAVFLMTENKIYLHIALMVILIMVSLIGGRVIPAFTVATLRRRGNRVFQTDQNLLTGLSVFSLVLVTIALIFGQESVYLSVLSFLAAALHLLRMRHYHVFLSLVDPMLWILHVGYMWLVFGLFLLGFSSMGMISFTVVLHAMTVGCIGSMILGMMCRVTLGHTGNNIHTDVLTILAFILMQGAAFIRVFGPWLMPEMMTQWIIVSASLWALCFAIYLYGYSGILFTGRAESDGIRIQQGRS